MKFITLLGSARKKGNTAAVLGWTEEALAANGHHVERIYLHNRKIGGCMGCGKCREQPERIGCVQKDDAVAIFEEMIAADGVLYASPVYFWGFSAQLKGIIDRGYALVNNYHRPEHTSLLAGKRLGLLVTGADAYEDNAEGLFTAFDRIVDFFLARKAGVLYVGGCAEPAQLTDKVRSDAAGLAADLMAD